MRVAGTPLVLWFCSVVVLAACRCQSVSAAAALVFATSKSSSTTAATSTSAPFSQVDIIRPGEAFRDTKAGELSVVSFNILAPTYHWLGMEPDDKNSQVESDRRSRVPMAIRMAKQVNADILCLQDVEGGSSEKILKELLEEPQAGLLGCYQPTSGGVGGDSLMGKRKARRQSAIQRVAEGNVDQPSPLRIDTVLATVDPDDPGRTQTIVNGLPNVPEGFPSDHIPIGVLFIFSPQPTYTRDDIENLNSIDNGDDLGQELSAQGSRRSHICKCKTTPRSLFQIVGCSETAECHTPCCHGMARGAREVVRAQPLFEWKWFGGRSENKWQAACPRSILYLE